ncbi:MAG: pallilysin-related adhesin [Leptolyngbya sp.]|nr:pallilysin-related adhesin [Candidatus Melainabacteria bacterium]
MSPDKLESWCFAAKSENPWFTPDSVKKAIAGITHFLNESALVNWTQAYNFVTINQKRVAIVMAGNVPMVGFHDLLCVLISGHHAIIKLSSKDGILVKNLLQELIAIAPDFENRYSIIDGPLKNFDAVIATGSDNSARYFHHYFGKYAHIIRKNRTSCAVLTGRESKEDISKLGEDVFSYFGLGCRNVSKLFIPQNFEIPLLLDQWKKYEDVIHHHKYNNNYDYQKAILLVNQVQHLDTGYLLLQESDRLVSPIAVLYYQYYNSEDSLINTIIQEREKLQCIVGNEAFCTVPFGQTQLPGLIDYADDVDTLDFLSKLRHTTRPMPRSLNCQLFRASSSNLNLVLVFFITCLAACSPETSTPSASIALNRDLIVPKAGPGIRLDAGNTNSLSAGDSASQVDLKIKLEPGQILQSAHNLNIDDDLSLEQVLVFKLKGDPDDLLRLLIVDFDANHGVWGNTWQGPTRATNIKTFNVRVTDVTSDGLPELVGQGVNKNGEQTLDIFKISSSAFPLHFVSILSINADISVEVQRPTDSNAAEIANNGEGFRAALGPRATASLDIVAQSKDLESQNSLDMVQTSYRWRSSTETGSVGQYVVASTARIPGSSVQEAALDTLYKGSVADFEKKFLSGAWVHTYVNQRKKNIVQLLFFDPEARTIRMVEGDRMESHEWQSSHKPVYGGVVQAYLVNESFRSQQSLAIIQAKGVNVLTFFFQDRDDWKGDFIRVRDELEDSFVSKSYRSVTINRLILSGLFKSDAGVELVFASPRFTWRSESLKRQGVFLSYQLNDTVLEFKFLDSRGIAKEARYYIAKLEEVDGPAGKRVLTLQQAHIGISGVAPLGGESLILEQSLADSTQ